MINALLSNTKTNNIGNIKKQNNKTNSFKSNTTNKKTKIIPHTKHSVLSVQNIQCQFANNLIICGINSSLKKYKITTKQWSRIFDIISYPKNIDNESELHLYAINKDNNLLYGYVWNRINDNKCTFQPIFFFYIFGKIGNLLNNWVFF